MPALPDPTPVRRVISAWSRFVDRWPPVAACPPPEELFEFDTSLDLFDEFSETARLVALETVAELIEVGLETFAPADWLPFVGYYREARALLTALRTGELTLDDYRQRQAAIRDAVEGRPGWDYELSYMAASLLQVPLLPDPEAMADAVTAEELHWARCPLDHRAQLGHWWCAFIGRLAVRDGYELRED